MSAPQMANFQPAIAKLSIGSLDDPRLTVKAHYNPKELQVMKQILWKAHNEQDRQVKAGTKQGGDQDSVEMTGAPSRAMSIELLFDGYETHTSIARQIEMLDRLSSPKNPTGPGEDERRPHYCVVVWGERGIPAFRCVIEQLVVKYTMFDCDGVPLRAVCTVNLKEADLRLKANVQTQQDAVIARAKQAEARAIVVAPPTPRPKPPGSQVPVPPRAATPPTAAKPAIGPQLPPTPAVPRPPSAARQAEAMQTFREVNGDAPEPVDPEILSELE